MDAWQAALLGLVEGVTEFLPISSTGHLVLAQHLLGIADSPAVHAFHICVQTGAIAAVLAVFRPRFESMARGLVGRDRAGLALAAKLMLAFVPAAIAGMVGKPIIEEHLFGIVPVAWAWLVGGAAILLLPRLRSGAEREGHALEALDWKRALAIGLCQCLALWPGTSRSLVTIGGALYLGLAGAAAVEFSLLLGLVTLLAATAYQSHAQGAAMLREIGPASLAAGFVAAFVSAWLAVRWLVAYLARHGLAVFGWYRIALAVVVAIAIASGALPA